MCFKSDTVRHNPQSVSTKSEIMNQTVKHLPIYISQPRLLKKQLLSVKGKSTAKVHERHVVILAII